MNGHRVPLRFRPKPLEHGEAAIVLPKKLVEKEDEIALGAHLVCNRRQFGECYRGTMPEIFDSMGPGGGVMVACFVSSGEILPAMSFPGDIDLLIIPYEDEQLIVSATLVVETKVVRARFSKQGKSPNEYGFSQAKAFIMHGFPYAAVGHLITSDGSPEDSWRKVLTARVLDADGRVDAPTEMLADMLPSALIDRSFGRLSANCNHDLVGFFATYMTDDGVWFPSAQPAKRNPSTSQVTLDAVALFYEKNYQRFIDTPKY